MADKPKDQVEMAPDPDEDDLDDLDGTYNKPQPTTILPARTNTHSDVLDQFNAQPKPAPAPASKPAPAPSTSQSSHAHDALPKDDELSTQLQSGMKDLMGELDSNPEMQREFERMMEELMQAGSAPTDAEAIEHIGKATEAINLEQAKADAEAGASSSKKSAPAPAAGSHQQESFQATIRKTMERMQASGASADAAAASDAPSSEEDMMAQLMKELQAGDGGEGGEEDFNKMLMSMMAQLTNKEILYEPMKELHDKFPAWMEKNRASTGKEDLARYEEQHALVKEIVGRFERKGYSDENDDDREYIVERMQKVRTLESELAERLLLTACSRCKPPARHLQISWAT